MKVTVCCLFDGKLSIRVDEKEAAILPKRSECKLDDLQRAISEIVDFVLEKDDPAIEESDPTVKGQLRSIGKAENDMEQLAVRPLDAAKAIGVGRTQIYNLLRTGQLPSVRIGKSIRVPVEALRAWMKAQTK